MATAPRQTKSELSRAEQGDAGYVTVRSRSSTPESESLEVKAPEKSEHDKGMEVLKAAFGEEPLRPTTGRGKKKTRKTKKSHRKTKKHLRRK